MLRPALLLIICQLLFINSRAQSLDLERALDHMQILSSDSLEGRRTDTEGNAKARKYIIDQFSKIGVAAYFPKYIQHFPLENEGRKITGTNVVGYIEGNFDATIVISAHYDHEGMKDSIIYNGADDNASGVSALLELASYFSGNQPDHTLIFCAFDGEELGLEGAKAFLSSMAVNSANIVMNINMDMISRSHKGILYAVGTSYYPYLKKFLPVGKKGSYSLATGHDNPSKPSENWTFSSDHGPFHSQKIPFIYFGVDDHEDYHQPTDTFDRIDPAFYGFAIETILQSIINLDKALIEDNNEE